MEGFERYQKAKTLLENAQKEFDQAQEVLQAYLEDGLSDYIVRDAYSKALSNDVKYALDQVTNINVSEKYSFRPQLDSKIDFLNHIKAYHNSLRNNIDVCIPEAKNGTAIYHIDKYKVGSKKQIKSKIKRTRELLQPLENGISWMYCSYGIDRKFLEAKKRIKSDPEKMFEEYQK